MPTTPNETFYPIDQPEIARQVNVAPKGEEPDYVNFYFKHPATVSPNGGLEHSREKSVSLLVYRGDEFNGKDTTFNRTEDSGADIKFCDKLLTRIESTYYYTSDEQPAKSVVLLADEEIQVNSQDYPEFPEGEVFTVKDLIEVGHKTTAVNAIFGSQFRVIPTLQKMGIPRKIIIEQSGGYLGEFKVFHFLKVPTPAQRSSFKNDRFIVRSVEGLSEQNKTTVPARVLKTNLEFQRRLYFSLVSSVTGYTVDGDAFNVHNPEHANWLFSADCGEVLNSAMDYLEGTAKKS